MGTNVPVRRCTIPLLLAAAGSACAGALQFTDITSDAGISALQITGPYPQEGFMMGGAAAGDFDRDGDVDLFIIRGGLVPDALYLNDGDGTFTDVSAAWGLTDVLYSSGVAMGDYDNDGRLDLFVTTHGTQTDGVMTGQHRLFRNMGSSFVDMAASAGVAMTSPVTPDGMGASFGDYDLDGDLDLAVAGWRGQSSGNCLFRNNGDGTFTNVTTTAIDASLFPVRGFTPRFCDMDGDRYPELLWVADFETSRYLRNDGDGTFSDITVLTGTALDQNGMGSTIGDFDGDGRLDWYVSSIHGANGLKTGNKLYMNQGGHVFTEVAAARGVDDGGWGWGVDAVDLDHDTDLDIVEANGWVYGEWLGENVKCYINDGTGSFAESSAAVGLGNPLQTRGVLTIDIDDDGDRDVLFCAYNDAVRLHRNDLDGDATHWIRLWFDTSSQDDLAPDGFGTRVTINAGGVTQVRCLDGGSTYLSVSELSVHAGLGAATVIDEITVEWANGRVNRFRDVDADQSLTIRPCFLDGDADGDGTVTFDDLGMLLEAWGQTVAPWRSGDVTGDGVVNFTDLDAMLDAWDARCPSL